VPGPCVLAAENPKLFCSIKVLVHCWAPDAPNFRTFELPVCRLKIMAAYPSDLVFIGEIPDQRNAASR